MKINCKITDSSVAYIINNAKYFTNLTHFDLRITSQRND